MEKESRVVVTVSILLVAVGILSLALNFVFNQAINISWPIVLILLGSGLSYLAGTVSTRWRWVDFLYIPGFGLLVMGVVFLLNLLTGDWNAWAYAWILVLSGLGLGLVLVCRRRDWDSRINLAGVVVVIAGITLAILFGAIAGGKLIQIIAPLILVSCGVGIYLLYRRGSLQRGLGELLKPAGSRAETQPAVVSLESQPIASPDQKVLVEPLSSRELEVLALIEEGLSNSQIAEKLSVATSTVKTHINNIYGKLGVQSRSQAIRRAKELNLLY